MFAFDTQTMFFHWFHCAGCILLILLLVVIALMLWRWRVHRDPLPPRARTVFNRTFHRKRNEENEIYSGRSTEMPNRQHTVSLFSCFLRSHDAISEEVFHLRWDTCQQLLQFDVLTTLLLIILVYLHSFSCCCVRNLRNPEKFTENSNLWSSRSSKVVDLGVNGKPMYDFLLVTNSNFGRICYRFRDIDD